MSFSDAKQVAENLKAAYPTDTFLAVAGVGGYCTGKCILKFGGWLVYKLTSSSAPSIADEKVKEKAFCCIDLIEETTCNKQPEERSFKGKFRIVIEKPFIITDNMHMILLVPNWDVNGIFEDFHRKQSLDYFDHTLLFSYRNLL